MRALRHSRNPGPWQLASARRLQVFAAALLGVFAGTCTAQADPDGPVPLPTPENPYVLHVYTDLLQIPALVIDWHGKPSTHLALQDFKLRIDSGPAFVPTAIHPEGNEPLDIALLLDATGAEDDLLSTLPKAPSHGFPQGLLPHDYIRVYAFDCHMLRSAVTTNADPAATHDSIASMLASPNLHKSATSTKTCRDTKRLWDSLATVASDIGERPGRHAVIVISDGIDRESKNSLEALLAYAQSKSIAIFAVREPPDLFALPRPPRGLGTDTGPSQDTLGTLAGSTGGIVLTAQSREAPARLDEIVTLLRSRYILQFPRPAETAGPKHHLDVSVSEKRDIVRTAGITYPIRDAALMNDPNTVPTDTSKLPIAGKGKH